jgi:C-terminal processing protease CtpA/Prc
MVLKILICVVTNPSHLSHSEMVDVIQIAKADIPKGSQFGARVARLKPNGPAAAAGLCVNDFILGVNGTAVGALSFNQIGGVISEAGDDIVLTVVAIDAIKSGQ